MTRVLFLQDFYYEYPGTMILSSCLRRAGHSADVLIEKRPGKILDYIGQTSPDLLAFSVMTGPHVWALETAHAIKAALPKMPVIIGGVHPTYFPEIIHDPSVDMICRGEGEGAMVELCDALGNGEDCSSIRNLWAKADGEVRQNGLRDLVDLTTLPPDDRDLYYRKYPKLAGKTLRAMTTSRGCPYACSFCFNHRLKAMYEGKGKYVRFKGVDQVLEEIRRFKSRYPIRRLLFTDDTLNLNRAWAREFFPRMHREFGIPYSCNVRANLIDEPFARLLKETGCVTVWMAVESGNEKLRMEVLKKNVRNERLLEAARLLHKHGVKLLCYNMICLPGETVEQAFETIDLNIRMGTDYPWCSILMPYSRTEIVDYAVDHGYLSAEHDISNVFSSYYVGSVLENPQRDRLLNLHRFFDTAVLMPWTLPLIRWLIRWPRNRLFDLWWGVVYTYVNIRSEGHRVMDVLRVLLDNIPREFFGNRGSAMKGSGSVRVLPAGGRS